MSSSPCVSGPWQACARATPRCRRGAALPRDGSFAWAVVANHAKYVDHMAHLTRSIRNTSSVADVVWILYGKIGQSLPSHDRTALVASLGHADLLGLDAPPPRVVPVVTQEETVIFPRSANAGQLFVWNLTQYTRVIKLDSDIRFARNADQLFRFQEGAHLIGLQSPLNGGLYVVEPSAQKHAEVQALARRKREWRARFSFVAADADQGFLFHLFQYRWNVSCVLDRRIFGTLPPEASNQSAVLHFPGVFKCAMSGGCSSQDERAGRALFLGRGAERPASPTPPSGRVLGEAAFAHDDDDDAPTPPSAARAVRQLLHPDVGSCARHRNTWVPPWVWPWAPTSDDACNSWLHRTWGFGAAALAEHCNASERMRRSCSLTCCCAQATASALATTSARAAGDSDCIRRLQSAKVRNLQPSAHVRPLCVPPKTIDFSSTVHATTTLRGGRSDGRVAAARPGTPESWGTYRVEGATLGRGLQGGVERVIFPTGFECARKTYRPPPLAHPEKAAVVAHREVQVQQLAWAAGVAPAILHVDPPLGTPSPRVATNRSVVVFSELMMAHAWGESRRSDPPSLHSACAPPRTRPPPRSQAATTRAPTRRGAAEPGRPAMRWTAP